MHTFTVKSLGKKPANAADLRKHAGIQWMKTAGLMTKHLRDIEAAQFRPFLAWDGEGWTDDHGYHRYMLLQNSRGDYIAAPELGTKECLALILKTATAAKADAKLAGTKNPIHVIFGGGYDATMILKDMPLTLRKTLAADGEVSWHIPASEGGRANNYRIKYIPHKWLEIWGYDWHHRKNAYVKIFDVMTFFQSSFITALTSRGLEVPAEIVSGKAGRNTFTYDDIDEIRAYCQMELELLVMLCNRLRDEFDEAGIYVKDYHGPGAVASAVFKEHGIIDHKSDTPRHIEQAAQRAYFGGRFEQFRAGHYAGKVYVYDINSAYPDKIRDLPSLAGAIWKRSDDYHGQPGLWFCTYQDPDNNLLAPHPLPWRGKGGIVGFPASHAGTWAWHHEAKYATEVHYGYELITTTDHKPFGFITEMYDRRRAWKAKGLGGEKALKLAMNSQYGKMAQRIGGADDGRPKWHQIEWAGMVTSATRAQLWDAIRQAPENIIAVETDSIASTVPLDLDIGEELGQWGCKIYDWMTYIQSGIYFTSDAYEENGVRKTSEAAVKSKSRGIDVTKLDYAETLAFLDSDQTAPMLVDTRMFIGLTNPRDYLYGQWTDAAKEVRVAGQKRLHMPSLCGACEAGEPMSAHMHHLAAAPLYGREESLKHPLPWLDGPAAPDPELDYVGTDAIEEYDVPRRIRA